MGSYQQRRVEYEVREFNGAGGGGQSFGGYGAASGGYGAASGGYGAGVGGGYGAASGGYGATSGGYGGASGGYGGASGGGYGATSGGGYGATSGGYGAASGGYGAASGGYGATTGECESYGGASGGYGAASGYGQAGMYKNEVQAMPAKVGVYGGGGEMFQSSGGHGDPFCALVPTSFPPGTDPKFIECFNRIDKDRSGLICDQELMAALSSFDQRFSLRTVHLLMYMFTGSNSKVVGPKEFVPLVRSLQTWKAIFQKYDCDRNGRLDERELKDALMSMGFMVSPFVLKLVMSKYDKSGYKCAIEYDYFIECCVVVKGLTEKFRSKEDARGGCGTASFTYDDFLLSVLPFIVA